MNFEIIIKNFVPLPNLKVIKENNVKIKRKIIINNFF